MLYDAPRHAPDDDGEDAHRAPDPLIRLAHRFAEAHARADSSDEATAEAERLGDRIARMPPRDRAGLRAMIEALALEVPPDSLPVSRPRDMWEMVIQGAKRLLPTMAALAAAQALVARADLSVWSYFSLLPWCC